MCGTTYSMSWTVAHKIHRRYLVHNNWFFRFRRIYSENVTFSSGNFYFSFSYRSSIQQSIQTNCSISQLRTSCRWWATVAMSRLTFRVRKWADVSWRRMTFRLVPRAICLRTFFLLKNINCIEFTVWIDRNNFNFFNQIERRWSWKR